MNIKSLTLPIIIILIMSGCTKKPDVDGTSAQKVAGEWWVTLDQGGTKDVFGIGHFKIATYNTAANGDSIWVDDFKNGWGFKAKAQADYNQLTFSKSTSPNFYYDPAHPSSFPLTVSITEGKVLTGVGHTKSGNLVDSIYMKVEFSDDAGTIYEMAGHARTGFFEDEY